MNDLEFEYELDRLVVVAGGAGPLGSVAVQGGFLLHLINAYRQGKGDKGRAVAERVQDAHMAGWVEGHNSAVLAVQGQLEDAVAEEAKAMGEAAKDFYQPAVEAARAEERQAILADYQALAGPGANVNWKYVFNPQRIGWESLYKAASAALAAGYRLLAWNGDVYFAPEVIVSGDRGMAKVCPLRERGA